MIVRTVKSITAKEILRLHPELKSKLCGGDFLNIGYYINTVGQYGNENVIQKYIQN
jgi:putative transposase